MSGDMNHRLDVNLNNCRLNTESERLKKKSLYFPTILVGGKTSTWCFTLRTDQNWTEHGGLLKKAVISIH